MVSRSAWLATAVLALNTLITIVIVFKFGSKNGIGTVYTVSLQRYTSAMSIGVLTNRRVHAAATNLVTTCLHVLINALSSVLLAASNYTMQVLVAPTRGDLDHAHFKGDWMDIGVASIRNLIRIRWYRTLVWLILALSSAPIHLLYNSAVFKSIDTNAYIAIVANPD